MAAPPVGALLERCHFPSPGSPIDLAVSGGRDSLGLLHLALAAGCEVTVHHVDHGLRPGSGAEAGVVAAIAANYGASFVAHRAKLLPGANLEARARAARFALLPEQVATGHTADDWAETILLNVLRGAALDGLVAMAPGPHHPILDLRRAEVAALVDGLDLEVVFDPSNADPAFRRNRVRHELLPLCCEIASRDIVPVLCRQAGLLAEERELLEGLAHDLDPSDVAQLRGAPRPLQRRALRRWLRSERPPYPPDSAAIDRILDVVRGEVRATELAGGRRVQRSRGRLFLG